MRLSTSTNMLYPTSYHGHCLDTIRTLGRAGFTTLDWCATAFSNQKTVRGANPFTTTEWKSWVEAQRNEADKLGIAFNQAHGSMYDYFAEDDHTAWLHSMTERIMQACVILGIDTIVYHPYEAPGSRELQNIDACRRANVEYLRRAGDMAGKYGLRIAVENMLSNRYMDGSIYWRYCTHAPELVDLVDAIDMENVQICLDVGHAHYMGENLQDTIKLYGKRLIALHIHDNNRADDQHLLPYHGTLPWDDVLLGLHAVDYAGDFTFEIQNATRRAPEALYPLLAHTAYEVGQYLLRRYEALAQKKEGTA